MSRALPAGRYGADDVEVGDWINCGSVCVTAEQIRSFAELTGDRFEIHMSDKAAQRHGFDRQVAHGLLVLSLVDGLKNQAPAQFKARASLGWDWTFRKPVLAGDQVFAMLTVLGRSAARAEGQAALALEFSVKNQNETMVQTGTNRLLCYR